jgi:signal transduction histidine kinase/CheY-like chemotaxis protein
MPHSIALGDVFRRSPNAYMIVDRELKYVAANEAYLRVTASTLEDLVGKSLFEAFPNDPDDPNNEPARLLRSSLERVLETRMPDALAMIQYRVPIERNGKVAIEDRYWSATHTPLVDVNGEVVGILQHTVEVTELQSLRAELRGRTPGPQDAASAQIQAGILGRAQAVQDANVSLDAERRHLRSLFEQAPGFTAFLRGPQHVFEIANSAYYELIGERREIIGKPVREALPEIADQGFPQLLDQVFEGGASFVGRRMKALLRRQPGAPLVEVYIDVVYQPIVDGSGTVTGIFVQGHDMTEQHRLEIERERLLEREKAAREEAERANRLKDDFLATVSHELRTPLTAMLGWVQLLRAGQITTEERRARALETIERNARAQSQLVEDLLDVSRIMSGKLQLHVEAVEVAAVVEAALESARPAADVKSLDITMALDADARIMGDAGRVQQIVWNLLSNAVKFTPKGGSVRVTVSRSDAAVDVVVTDSGQGIGADFLPHVFEPFRQAEGASTRKHGGLGLGLAIVKHLVELHGGTLSVTSEGEGRGATFTVTLPTAVARTEASITGKHRRVDDSVLELPSEIVGLRLLVVDDEEDTRELLRAILERCGATVETASNADEGVALFQRMRPDVVVSDIGMPGEDGYSLIRRLRALPDDAGRTPAVALTAFARGEDRTRALMAGFKAHVPKPVDPRELVAVLLSVVQPTTAR